MKTINYYVQTAKTLGYNTIEKIPLMLYEFSMDGVKFHIAERALPVNSSVARFIATQKHLTSQLLKKAGFNTGNQVLIAGDRLSEIQPANWLGRDIVIKPTNGSGGKGVTILPRTAEQLSAAFAEAARYSDQIVVEDYIAGNDYRVLVVGGKAISVVMRTAPSVVGDGVTSIEGLIAAENSNRRERATNEIIVDLELDKTLEQQGLNTQSILAVGTTAKLRQNSNISTGGTAIDITEEVHQSIKDIAVSVSQEIPGLKVAGIDLILKEHKMQTDKQGLYVNEVNSFPSMELHEFSVPNGSSKATAKVLNFIFEESRNATA